MHVDFRLCHAPEEPVLATPAIEPRIHDPEEEIAMGAYTGRLSSIQSWPCMALLRMRPVEQHLQLGSHVECVVKHYTAYQVRGSAGLRELDQYCSAPLYALLRLACGQRCRPGVLAVGLPAALGRERLHAAPEWRSGLCCRGRHRGQHVPPGCHRWPGTWPGCLHLAVWAALVCTAQLWR